MRPEWYGDKRDLVKWGALATLAEQNSINDIIYVAYLRPSKIPKLEVDGRELDLPTPVWQHFRNIDDIKTLGTQLSIRIHVIKNSFSHGARASYRTIIRAEIAKLRGAKKIIFLDPDTGIEPTNAKAEHVTKDDIAGCWGSMETDDWLVLYQHERQGKKDWLDTTRKQFQIACGVPQVSTFRGINFAHDVAFFAARKGLECNLELKRRLSARASLHICKTATRFISAIEFTYGSEVIDAKSPNLVSFGVWSEYEKALLAHNKTFDNSFMKSFASSWNGLKAGSVIKIVARGSDASEALEAILADFSSDDLDFG